MKAIKFINDFDPWKEKGGGLVRKSLRIMWAAWLGSWLLFWPAWIFVIIVLLDIYL